VPHRVATGLGAGARPRTPDVPTGERRDVVRKHFESTGGGAMTNKRTWEIGGFVAGALLILFGAVAVFMGVNGFTTVRDSIKQEGIYFGDATDPAVAKY